MTPANAPEVALVTGVPGQDDACLVGLLPNKGYQVDGIERRANLFDSQRIDHLMHDAHDAEQRSQVHDGELTDSSNLVRLAQQVRPDEICNPATMSHVAARFEQPDCTADADGIGALRHWRLAHECVQARWPMLQQDELDGRNVLQLDPESRELPYLAPEDEHRDCIPTHPTAEGVFGRVFDAASCRHSPGRTLEQYLRLAGGPTEGAHAGSIFVLRANGYVLSNRQGGGMFTRGRVVDDAAAEPGDTISVPEELDKTTITQFAKDWTQILYQFGIGIAGIVALSK